MSEPAPSVDALPATAGELLRAARERQGVRLAGLAESLKVSQRKLELIESNRFDDLPDATFTRALALSMCRALKIDAEPVLSHLPQLGAHGLDTLSLGLNEPFRDRAGRGDSGGWRQFLSLPLIGAALLVLGAVLVYLLPSGPWSIARLLPAASEMATRSMAASAARSVTDESPAPMATAPPPLAGPAASVAAEPAPQPVATPASAQVVDTVFSSSTAAASVPLAGGLLTLRAVAESWIEVRDRDGQVLLSRTLAPGEATGLDGTLPLRVTVGNAEATQVVFRGRAVALVANRDNVARLELR